MDSWNNSRENDKPTDRLERDSLPPNLEAAQAEYFADMAFDDRLLNRLEEHVATTTIDATYVTTSCDGDLTRDYFPSNTTSEVEHYIAFEEGHDELILGTVDAYAFHLTGSLENHPDALSINARIESELGDYPSVRIQSDTDNPDCFYISKDTDEFDVTIISTKELLAVLCRLNGARGQDIETLLDNPQEPDANIQKKIRTAITDLWKQIGDNHGKRKTVHEITHDVKTPAHAASPEKINLRYEELENPDVTLIKLFLEHSTEHFSLDAKEAYCLTLVFEQINEKNTHKVAEKIVVSGIEPKLISHSFEKKTQGRVTPLNIDSADIKELFVDWFDQIIST